MHWFTGKISWLVDYARTCCLFSIAGQVRGFGKLPNLWFFGSLYVQSSMSNKDHLGLEFQILLEIVWTLRALWILVSQLPSLLILKSTGVSLTVRYIRVQATLVKLASVSTHFWKVMISLSNFKITVTDRKEHKKQFLPKQIISDQKIQ